MSALKAVISSICVSAIFLSGCSENKKGSENLSSEGFKLESVWKAQSPLPGKQNFAVFENDDGLSVMLVFGRKDGRLKYRAFPDTYFSESFGNSSYDNFYKIVTAPIVRGESLKVTLSARRSIIQRSFEIEYTKVKSDSQDPAVQAEFANLKEKATNALTLVLNEMDDVREIEDPQSIGEFKKMLDIIRWDSKDLYNNLISGFLPTLDLQIWSEFEEVKMSSRAFAAIEIQEDGNDDISRAYREGAKWEEMTFEELEGHIIELVDSNQREGDKFSAYSTNNFSFTSEAYQKGAEKYVKYEIQNISGYDCEDSTYLDKTYYWVLKDGSVYTYAPDTECD